MRRFLLSAIILSVICGIFFMHPEQHAPTQENPFLTLQHIMELAEASIVEGEIHYWASLGPSPKNLSLEDLESRADEPLGRIAIFEEPEEPKEFKEPEDQKGFAHAVYYSKESVVKDGKDSFPEYMVVEREQELQSGARARLLLQQMDEDGRKTMHLLLTVTREGEIAPLSDLVSRIPAAFRSEAENSNLSFCLTGHIDGELLPGQMEQLAREITREIGGDKVQSVQDGGMVSVTGYTPDLGDYLKAENLRINLNLAMRYDDYLGKTVIWAGTPLIAGQY